MDLILNHIGSEHWWMYDLPSSDWINYGGTFVQTNHTHHSIYDPHTPQSEKDRFTDGWFGVEQYPKNIQISIFLAKPGSIIQQWSPTGRKEVNHLMIIYLIYQA